MLKKDHDTTATVIPTGLTKPLDICTEHHLSKQILSILIVQKQEESMHRTQKFVAGF